MYFINVCFILNYTLTKFWPFKSCSTDTLQFIHSISVSGLSSMQRKLAVFPKIENSTYFGKKMLLESSNIKHGTSYQSES